MDAPEAKSVVEPVPPGPVPPYLVRIVVAGLAIVLAWGLWQAYGEWLFSPAASHVF
jgi:hypothetical protein